MLNHDLMRTIADTELEPVLDRLGAVAAQLVDAACHAWNGDRERVKARISHALSLLGNELGHAVPPVHPGRSTAQRVFRGGLASWQARRLLAHIDTNLAGRIFLEDLARLADLSNGHFCRAFKQTFGVPAHAYIMRRRIEFAQGVMLKTKLPLSEIALSCGLSDQSHFTRTFRRIVGETPHAWRRVRRDALDHAQAVRPGAAAV